MKELTNSKSKAVKFLDQLKQTSFYTEAIGKKPGKEYDWLLTLAISDEKSAKFYLTTAECVVFDDGIMWSELTLKIFTEFYYLKDGEVHNKNQIEYYKTLKAKGCISHDRLQKILTNIKANN